jgi:putative ABC transport system permease protein
LPGTIPVADASVEMLLASVQVDYMVLGFTVLVSVLTGVLFGLAPVLYALREDVGGLLKESSRGTSGGTSQGRLRDALVVGEVALALVLLIGAGLMTATFRNLMHVETGFQPDGVLALQMELPTDSKYQTGPERSDFLRSVLTEVETIPGIESFGLTGVLPLETRVDQAGFLIEGDPPLPDGARQLLADYSEVSADYFATMRIPLVRGRYFANSDDRDHRGVAIISESLAKRHFNDRDPLGRRLKVDGGGPWEIVGVVGDIHHEGLDKSPRPTIYLPYFQRAGRLLTIVARAAGDPQSLVRPIKEAVWRVDNEQPLYRIRTMAEVVEQSRSTPRLTVILLGSMAGLALLMAAVGIYGVLSYSISQRRREIGVRIAVGARSVDVFALILRKSLTLAGAGVVIGLVAGSLLSRAMGNLLFEVRATDPFVLGTVALGLMAVAALAGFLPARRASKVDPVITLRYE